VLVFPESINVLAIDGRTIDPRAQVQNLRVTPGAHVLRFSYSAVGPGGSPQHAGQQAAPFPLEVQAGHKYLFEAKT
jgi:hypothetical protein